LTLLLERERELAELDDAIARTTTGTGGLVAIEAQAGLGKTRLLQAAREAGAEADLNVLVARATELERDFPFALVRQLFEPQLAVLSATEREALFEGADAARPALGLSSTTSESERGHDTFSVLHGLYWLTAALAERHPLLLAVDDAHWSDAASLDYLGFLLPRLEELPVLVVVASRPSEPGSASSLPRIVTDTLARRLTPTALSPAAARTLLTAELGDEPEDRFAETCHEVSGGNPFLLSELARTLVVQAVPPTNGKVGQLRELVPERVTRTVLVRLGQLPSQARAVARALVVLGDESDPRRVAALAGVDQGEVLDGADALRAVAILEPGASLRFVHPLVRNAIDSNVPAGERAAAHARAATLLRADGAGPEQIAAHLVATEPREQRETVEVLLEAGVRALKSGAPSSTVTYLLRALREPAPADLRADVLHPLITASIRTGDHSIYEDVEAEALAEIERTPALLDRWAIKLAGWMLLHGRFERAVELLEQAIQKARDADDVERVFRLEAQRTTLAQLALDAGSFVDARASLARYHGSFDPDSASGRLAAALKAEWTLFNGSAAEAVELARVALRDGKIFAEQPEFGAPGSSVMVLTIADEVDAAERSVARSLALARERSATPELVGSWWLQAFNSFWRGDLAGAEADLRQAMHLASMSEFGMAVGLLSNVLMALQLLRGDLDAVEAQLTAWGMATGEIPDTPLLAFVQYVRGHLHLERGRADQAAEDLMVFVAHQRRLGMEQGPVIYPAVLAVRALVACGRVDEARELADTRMQIARRWGTSTVLGCALRGQALTRTGPEAIELLRQAVALLADSPSRLERAYALSDLGAVLRRENSRAEAREPLREALELARACGAGGLAKRVYDDLRATGEKVRRHTPIGVDSLTPSERRVAEMAASGMTNRQIAQDLFLTVKTIETHLSAAYDKLGIRSRQQLAAVLAG
jgi:DNA-binding NarL/FixJ family response regulator